MINDEHKNPRLSLLCVDLHYFWPLLLLECMIFLTSIIFTRTSDIRDWEYVELLLLTHTHSLMSDKPH